MQKNPKIYILPKGYKSVADIFGSKEFKDFCNNRERMIYQDLKENILEYIVRKDGRVATGYNNMKRIGLGHSSLLINFIIYKKITQDIIWN